MPVIAHVREVVAIADVEAMLAAGGAASFSEEERRYAASKTDESRRLAARWAAKVATSRALGGGVRPEDVDVRRDHGAPYVRLSRPAEERRVALGSPQVHVTLTHGLTHAAASVVLESD